MERKKLTLKRPTLGKVAENPSLIIYPRRKKWWLNTGPRLY